ncbi:MAG: hypothetical protein WC551_13635 [Patescibacteria group bacterium]|jgi:hypothetical protein
MAKYIKFDEVIPHPGGMWEICEKRMGYRLGGIEWYAPWRRYVASFSENSVWSEDCLADVIEFMRGLGKAGR